MDAGLATLLEQLARAGVSVHTAQGRLGVSPKGALARFAPQLKEHKDRLLELATAAGDTLTPERLAELARELADAPPPERPKRQTLEGCPIHWTRVPELPRDRPVPLADDDGFGCLYRLEAHGVWWLVKFLPPFDGRLSLTDPHGRVRVLASLDEAMRVLEVLEATPPVAPTRA